MNTPSISHLEPVKVSERIHSLDVVRGIALLGILLMNIVGFGLAWSYSNPSISGGDTGANLYTWITTNMLFEGTMRGLFTMLFGMGFILLTLRGEKKGGGIKVADIYYRRTLWLLLFGIIHGYLLLWYGEILYPYAVMGLLLFPVRHVNPKPLFIAGIVLLTIGVFLDFRDYNKGVETYKAGTEVQRLKDQNQTLTTEQTEQLKAFTKLNQTPTSEEVSEYSSKMRNSGYFKLVDIIGERVFRSQTVFFYRYSPWDILSMMLIGMALFKWKVFNASLKYKYYLIMMIVGYAVGLTVNYFETSMIVNSGFDKLTTMKADRTYQIGRFFTTIGHIGLIMIFVKSSILKFLQNALGAVGKMALTNYLMHTILCNIYFLGFNMFGKLQRYELYYVVGLIWIFQLIISPIWLKYFRYGPAEWMWRSLTYLEKQPFRINKPETITRKQAIPKPL
ncbi:DUF418 domain-containing protein [Mangrovivirga sp. M17]|uniref:DUF418 domain-containing protein n=1 Tax=Mangrovivirga halotolerans TaxID=2993936 RepID=A0ABT3RNX6_9BACT|nr:DUF418 domain-containing protein [Mangrovivirga halotolerans]MCX2743292.1 DUF418 domain-containing protein [Mangrovivirga halotolerans]